MNNNAETIQSLAINTTSVEKKINESAHIVGSTVLLNDKTVRDFEKTESEVKIIVSQILEINTISLKNARSVEEIAAAAEHLNSMTATLHSKLKVFTT